MTDQSRAAFEAAYIKLFPTSCLLNREKFARDALDEYEQTTVYVAFNLWQAGRESMRVEAVNSLTKLDLPNSSDMWIRGKCAETIKEIP